MILSTEAEKYSREIPEMMQAISQAAGNPSAHFAITTGEKYPTYLVKVQVSQDPILIHSSGSALGKFQERIGTRGHKALNFQRAQRIIHDVQGRPKKDSRVRKQERKNAVHRIIEGKNSIGD